MGEWALKPGNLTSEAMDLLMCCLCARPWNLAQRLAYSQGQQKLGK